MITLLTDFGTADYFVPAIKGVILSINPQAQIIDLTHEIPAQDVSAAAFTLGACYRNFPAGTIHVAVVDPGVGSARRAIVAAVDGHLFVGPDNGIFSYVIGWGKQGSVFQIEREDLFRQPVSATFHGRDVFAPIAAHLSKGLLPEAVGSEIQDFIRLEIPRPIVDEQHRRILGKVIHIDRFGNCITNLTEQELLPDQANLSQLSTLESTTKVLLAGQQVTQFGSHFAQAIKPGKLFAYLGSAGFWEVALWCDSAAERFSVNRGASVTLELPCS